MVKRRKEFDGAVIEQLEVCFCHRFFFCIYQPKCLAIYCDPIYLASESVQQIFTAQSVCEEN